MSSPETPNQPVDSWELIVEPAVRPDGEEVRLYSDSIGNIKACLFGISCFYNRDIVAWFGRGSRAVGVGLIGQALFNGEHVRRTTGPFQAKRENGDGLIG